jgi:hypothetical protein
MKRLRRTLLISLWLPVLWASLLVTDIFLFTGGRPTKIIQRLFEDVVFTSSFFFYGMSGGGVPHSGFWSILKPLAIQFFFWWLISFAVVYVYRLPRKMS